MLTAVHDDDSTDGHRRAPLGANAATPPRRPDRRWPALNLSAGPAGGDDTGPFAALPRPTVDAFTGNDDDQPRYIIYLPVVAPDLAAALDLAASLARSLTFMPQIEVGDTTVSEEGRPDVRRRVFCDRLLPGRRRCARRARHDGPCGADG